MTRKQTRQTAFNKSALMSDINDITTAIHTIHNGVLVALGLYTVYAWMIFPLLD